MNNDKRKENEDNRIADKAMRDMLLDNDKLDKILFEIEEYEKSPQDAAMEFIHNLCRCGIGLDEITPAKGFNGVLVDFFVQGDYKNKNK